ncbi:MAG: alpha/beta fold hydrolase, partial [Thermoleophilia bacterium]|nr:alpha/beta fold hydrolase [Thermoleophilia bacterium]
MAEPESGRGRRRRPPRAVTYPYRRIERVEVTPADEPDPYGDDSPAWLAIDWGRHLRTIEAGGTPINYAEIGEGPAIVFVHGLGGCWQNWLENMPRMAALGFRAIALDLPGFGSSPMPPWQISI